MRKADSHPTRLRGYFAIGAERISKAPNLRNLMRSAHAFGASFVFTVAATDEAIQSERRAGYADTSRSVRHLPVFGWSDVAEMSLPGDCELVGIELVEEATELPSFRHPLRAAYVLGAERFGLSSEMLEACDHVVRIPTAFSLNIATAGAIVMYDRVRTLGRFPAPPVRPGGPLEELPEHVHGEPVIRAASPRS